MAFHLAYFEILDELVPKLQCFCISSGDQHQNTGDEATMIEDASKRSAHHQSDSQFNQQWPVTSG
jgi:hypothetical protein